MKYFCLIWVDSPIKLSTPIFLIVHRLNTFRLWGRISALKAGLCIYKIKTESDECPQN